MSSLIYDSIIYSQLWTFAMEWIPGPMLNLKQSNLLWMPWWWGQEWYGSIYSEYSFLCFMWQQDKPWGNGMQHYYTSFLASEAKCRSLSCSSFSPLGTEETAFTLSVIQHSFKIRYRFKLFLIRQLMLQRQYLRIELCSTILLSHYT